MVLSMRQFLLASDYPSKIVLHVVRHWLILIQAVTTWIFLVHMQRSGSQGKSLTSSLQGHLVIVAYAGMDPTWCACSDARGESQFSPDLSPHYNRIFRLGCRKAKLAVAKAPISSPLTYTASRISAETGCRVTVLSVYKTCSISFALVPSLWSFPCILQIVHKMAGDFPNLDSTSMSTWPKPTYVDPETRSWFPVFSVCLMTSATIIFVARIWTQIRTSNSGLGLDDLFISCSWVFSILFTTACLMGTLEYGFDRHLWDIEISTYKRAALTQWLSEGAFMLSITCTKVSVLLFYRRLDLPCTTAFRRIIYFLITLIICYSTASILTQILLCHPTSSYWNIAVFDAQRRKKCTSQRAYYLIQGSLDIISTLYTITIPYLRLRDIPMVQFHRNALKGIVTFSLSVGVAAVARTVFLSRLVNDLSGDATWNGFNIFVCSQMECQLAIICASLPYLRHYSNHNPSLPMVLYTDSNKDDSIISRVGSSLSGQIKRLPFPRRNSSPRELQISSPRPQSRHAETPEWEFETIRSPRHPVSPVSPADEITYAQYVRGNFGPPAPPKDNRALFEEYRRERGVFI
ncbi:hypothetical protein P280DRAFT_31958 [Massarina eburnea CBS 473.64]|uniref:Rhodopsin domain-containing protein n=1 Tax=Massarina eburnea CBS 473.64 TaxID=1395130 RepID=A0A6A6S202_9PLEO|nr:hypothetical protein P280DRAFT_31958 [Massarina eburnea CBS 473.64]